MSASILARMTMANFTSVVRRTSLVCCSLLALATAVTTQAQNEIGAQIGTEQDVLRRGERQTTQREIPFRLTDPELGEIDVVSRAPRPKMFTFSTDQNLLYTSNAFLARNNDQNTFFWNGRFAGSFVPYATRNFTPRLTFEQNFFRYDKFSQLDFDSNSLQLDVKYDLDRDDTSFINVSYTGSRLYTPRGDAGEFYKYGLLNASFTHVRPLGSTPLRAIASVGSNWRHGDPSEFDRATLYVNGVLVYSPIDTVQVIGFIRPEVQFYLHDPDSDSRTDLTVTAGVSFVWTPIEYFSLGTTATVTGNYSTTGENEYDVFLPSVFVSGRFAF